MLIVFFQMNGEIREVLYSIPKKTIDVFLRNKKKIRVPYLVKKSSSTLGEEKKKGITGKTILSH